jgi:YVTN family beta-propeller protein
MAGYAQMQDPAAKVGTGTFPDGVASNPVTNKTYVANQANANVTVIDGATNKTTTVPTGTTPHAVVVNSVTNKIYVTNEGSGTVTVIDGDSNTTASIAIGTGPHFMALNSTTNKIYVANEGSNTVTVIDGATNATTTLAAENLPGAVAVNQVTNKIYIVNKCGKDPTCASAANVTVIDGVTNNTTTVATAMGSGAIAVNPTTNKIYVANSASNTLTVIDGATNDTAEVVAAEPGDIAVNEVTNQIYVASGAKTLTVIDGFTNDTSTVQVGAESAAVTVNSATNEIYLLNPTRNSITVVDGATRSVSRVFAGNLLIAAALNPVTNQIYLATLAGSNVTMIDGVTHNLTLIAVNPVANPTNLAIQAAADTTVKSEEQQGPLLPNTAIRAIDSPTNSTPEFTFTAAASSSGTASETENVYFQVDSLQGPWIPATRNGETFTGKATSALSSGAHILYACTADGQDPDSTSAPHGLVGQIAGEVFAVASTDDGPLTSIVPNSALAGGTAFTLTVNGSGFVSMVPVTGGTQSTVVEWNGSIRNTTFVNSSQLTAAIPASDIQTPGTAQVSVVLLTSIMLNGVPATQVLPQPDATGFSSLPFTILATASPVPTSSSISPTSATAGGAGLTLTVTGTNFVSNSVVQWNGVGLVTTFVSATQLTAAVPASDLATAGTVPVTVFTPTPGGGTSGVQTFTINAAAPSKPTLATISPSSATAGGPGFTLMVTGTNFVSNSSVQWNGVGLTTTFGSATQLTAAVPASDIAAAGTIPVTVSTPNVGASSAITFTINASAPSKPTLAMISPSSATAGGPTFTLTVTGTNFVSNSSVQWNGVGLTTTFGSATQLTAAVPASDIASAGTVPVTVSTPNVGASSALTFTINASGNAVPTLTMIQPSTIPANSAFSLVATGTNFVSTSVVKLNGMSLATTFNSATQLTAAVTAAAIPSSGSASVTVFNTTPGGGTSSAMTLTIVPFSIPSQPSAQTVAAGQAANFTIPTAPAGAGPAPTLSFAATGLPVGSAAAFMPSSVTAGTSSTMMVTTTSRTKSATTYEQFGPGGSDSPASLPAGVAFLALFLILAGSTLAGPLRKPLGRLAPVAALILVLVAAGYLAACTSSSSSGNPNGTPAGSYTIKVTVSSATGGLSTNVTLNVQ